MKFFVILSVSPQVERDIGTCQQILLQFRLAGVGQPSRSAAGRGRAFAYRLPVGRRSSRQSSLHDYIGQFRLQQE